MPRCRLLYFWLLCFSTGKALAEVFLIRSAAITKSSRKTSKAPLSLPTNLTHGHPRDLQEECEDLRTVDGPFNTDSANVPVTGFFFEVQAEGRDVTVNTVELDVVFGLGNSLDIDVYSSSTAVVNSFGNELAWSLAARTALLPHPDGISGALLAAHQFTPIPIKAGERMSFYFRMKGPYLDHQRDPSIPSGSRAIDGDLLNVFAGYHVDLTDAEFPTSLRTDVSPILAGKIHFQVDESCDTVNLVSTMVEYVILVDISLLADDFDNINTAMNNAVSTLLTSDEKLEILVNDHGLQMDSSGTRSQRRDYLGDCPPLYALCTAVASIVPLRYSDKITVGEVKEQMFMHTGTFAQTMLGALRAGTQGAYVGLLPAQARFLIEMEGVSQTDIMDEEQGLYFQGQALELANSEMTPEIAQVFKFEVTDQRLFDLDSIAVQGTVRGGILSTFSQQDFAQRVQAAIKQNKGSFIANLRFFQFYPGPLVKEGRYEFFANLNDIPTVQINETVGSPVAAPSSSSSGDSEEDCDGANAFKCHTMYFIYGGIGLAGLIILTICVCIFIGYMKNRRNKDSLNSNSQREGKKGDQPPGSIAFGDDDTRQRRRPSRTGLMHRENSYSESETFFHDEHSLNGSSSGLTERPSSSKHLYAAPTSRSSQATRRASTGHHGSEKGREQGRRSSTGAYDSDDTDEEDRIFGSERRKGNRPEYEDYDDYKPRRSNSSRSLRSDSHHSRHSKRRSSHHGGSHQHKSDDRDDSGHGSSYSYKRSGSNRSLSSHGLDDMDHSDSHLSESHRSGSHHHKKKKKKKHKKKSERHHEDGSSRSKLRDESSNHSFSNRELEDLD